MGKRVEKNNSIFQYRLEKHHDELRWLYMELYQNDDMFAELCSKMYEYYRHRSSKLKECNINCLHLMPFLDTPEGRSDGGYAVADFRKIRPDLGTVKDLAELAEKCHEEDINVCMEHDDSVLCILREYKGRRFFGIFNFSDQEKTAWMQEDGVYRNLLTSEKMELKDIRLRGYDFLWCENKLACMEMLQLAVWTNPLSC